MGDGYVLDLNDHTFSEFVLEAIGINPYAAGMDANGTSKARRLRHIFKTQPDHIVGTLLKAFLELEDAQRDRYLPDIDDASRQRAHKAAERLCQSRQVEDASALIPNTADGNFEVLANEIRGALESGKPEVALDRLHTFATKFIRAIYGRHFHRPPSANMTASSLLGEYANDLRSKQVLDSRMASEILKSSARVLEEFNHVRNNQTLAHDNASLISRSEARFIFASVAASIRFIRDLEDTQQRSST